MLCSYDRLPLNDELRAYRTLTLEAIRQTQQQFWDARTGGRRRIKRTALHGRRFYR